MADPVSSSDRFNKPSTTENHQTYPTDPFEKDFRSMAANMSIEEIRQSMAPDFQDVTDDDIRALQSREWAERLRPMYQWKAILNVGYTIFLRGFVHESSDWV